MDPDIRAEKINALLENSDLRGVSQMLDIPYSTFTKEMQKGDYVYIARENKYFKFIRNKNDYVSSKSYIKGTEDYTEELAFLKENLEMLKKLVANSEENKMLILDKAIYDTKAKFVNKNLKVNEAIYEKFSKLCESQFPHLKIQDIIAQSLLDFINKYQNH